MQQRKENIARMAGVRILILVTINAIFITKSLGSPASFDSRIEMKRSWQDNSLAPIIPEPCSPTEPCWQWIPAVPLNREEAEVLHGEPMDFKLQEHPQMDEEMNSGADDWKPNSRVFVPRSSSTTNARQVSPRPVKKDVFTSRNWGPGGLPFSVLYMSPHPTRTNSNRPSYGASEAGPTKNINDAASRRAYEGQQSTASPVKHPNYRVTLRNGGAGPPRRQYSIIPQLFISYGWGPLGK